MVTRGWMGRWMSTRKATTRRVPIRETVAARMLGSALADQPLQPPGVLVHPHRPDPWEGDVLAVGFDPDRAGGEGDPVPVAALLREPREPYPLAPACSGPRGLPVPVGVHRGLDPVAERLLADLRPPHLTCLGVGALGVFGLVPPFPQPGQRRHRGLLAGLPVPGDVFLEGADRPVAGIAAPAELPPQARLLLRECSPARTGTPAPSSPPEPRTYPPRPSPSRAPGNAAWARAAARAVLARSPAVAIR